MTGNRRRPSGVAAQGAGADATAPARVAAPGHGDARGASPPAGADETASAAEVWLAGARAGDAAAFNRLVDLFQDRLYHVAVHQMLDADEALDACQEALLSAWRSLPRFAGDADDLRRWLLAIVVNACRDRQRYARRRPSVPIDSRPDGRLLQLADPARSPESHAENAELREVLTAALALLSEDHRAVVLLDHAGLSYAEIAEALGVEVGTVKSRLARARGHLRELLTHSTSGVGEPRARGGRSPDAGSDVGGGPAAARTERADDHR